MNLRPSGYEPDELPDCSIPRQYINLDNAYLHQTDGERFNLIILTSSGWRRIRTFEGVANRFTVCPLWPLGNPSKYLFVSNYSLRNGTNRARTYDPLLVRQVLSQLSYDPMGNLLISDPEETRTLDLRRDRAAL